MLKKIIIALICFYACTAIVFAQQPTAVPETTSIPAFADSIQRMDSIKRIYANGDYAGCRFAIDELMSLEKEKKLELSFFQMAKIYSYKALVAYAFREEGYQDEVKRNLLRAVQTDLNFDFEDYAIIPAYVVDVFIKTKREYHDMFSKTTRRHTMGIYGSLTAIPTILDNPEYLKPGVHYSYNFSESFMLVTDVEFPATANIFNSITGRVGIAWFPSFKVETVSMGLLTLYGIKLEKNTNALHVVSFEGYGEFILRLGLGLAVSIELLRMDLVFGDEPGDFSETGSVEIISTDQVRLTSGNLRFYLFWTF